MFCVSLWLMAISQHVAGTYKEKSVSNLMIWNASLQTSLSNLQWYAIVNTK